MCRRRAILILITTCLAIAGCGGNKASRFYQMTATGEMPEGERVADTDRVVVLLDPVLVPDYIKRAPIVVRVGESELRLEEFHRWISDPEDNARRVLIENISRRCPEAAIALSPWIAPNDAAYRIGVAIDTFELTDDEQAVLIARWTITHGERNWSRPNELRLTRPTGVDPKEKGYDQRVAALSGLLSELSEAIATALNQAIAESGAAAGG